MQKDELISLANEMCKELLTIIDQEEILEEYRQLLKKSFLTLL